MKRFDCFTGKHKCSRWLRNLYSGRQFDKRGKLHSHLCEWNVVDSKKVIRPEPTTAPEPTSTPVLTPEPTIEPTETSTPAPTVEPTVNPLPMPTEKLTEGVVQYPAVKSETVVKPDWKTVEKENTEESIQAESSDSTDTSEAAEAPESMPTETQLQPENTTKPANIQVGKNILNVGAFSGNRCFGSLETKSVAE